MAALTRARTTRAGPCHFFRYSPLVVLAKSLDYSSAARAGADANLHRIAADLAVLGVLLLGVRRIHQELDPLAAVGTRYADGLESAQSITMSCSAW